MAMWSTSTSVGWVRCGNCGLNVLVAAAVVSGCTRCGLPPYEPPTVPATEVLSHHKFSRFPPSSTPSTKKVCGIWTSKERIPPKAEGAVRFVCVSDTHESTSRLGSIPEGDILIHAGDFTYTGGPEAVQMFDDWLASQPHEYKVVIAGNHDVTFDLDYYPDHWHRYGTKHDAVKTKNLLKSCIYLEDSEVVVKGIRIYGSPWSVRFCDWAFNASLGEECQSHWNLIPVGVDVLITHGPPYGKGDKTVSDLLVGCPDLLKVIKELEIPVNICGHIHEGYGIRKQGKCTFINASSVNYNYKPVNAPIVFDLI
eukprot:TRINITY_DN4659_c0_g1_i11.p1 TRINITY_DN4659_c0_g1~~TRINITY_DN4659_c0_g1_i11.p1  ORF type:complete len:310 (-),score=43.02 TRINITY_DN4659_c0_g1_i11:119-1048(-)